MDEKDEVHRNSFAETFKKVPCAADQKKQQQGKKRKKNAYTCKEKQQM